MSSWSRGGQETVDCVQKTDKEDSNNNLNRTGRLLRQNSHTVADAPAIDQSSQLVSSRAQKTFCSSLREGKRKTAHAQFKEAAPKVLINLAR